MSYNAYSLFIEYIYALGIRKKKKLPDVPSEIF